MSDARCQTLLVKHDDPATTRVADAAVPTPDDGQTLVRVQRFALTANNVTYAVLGEQLGYWQFYPHEAPWGVVPVWGFGEVIEDRGGSIEVGTRLYGYFPLASHALLQLAPAGPGGWKETSAHRLPLAGVYNRYQAIAAGDEDADNRRALLHPLLATAFLIADFLDDNDCFGAHRVLLGSASSKTALCLAQLLRGGNAEVLGLTSPGRIDTVRATGAHARVLAYGDIDELETDVPSVFVDMGGNAAVRDSLHRRLGDQLKYSCAVGLSHWDAQAPVPRDLPGPRPQMFFAPARSKQRAQDWGPAELQRRIEQAYTDCAAASRAWLSPRELRGIDAIAEQWLATVRGEVPAELGLIALP